MRVSFLIIYSKCSTFVGPSATKVDAVDSLLPDYTAETISFYFRCYIMFHFAEALRRICLREDYFATLECMKFGVLRFVDR